MPRDRVTELPTPSAPPAKKKRGLFPKAVEPAKPGEGAATNPTDAHEGASDEEIGDRTGPAAGYDKEPEQVRDRGGVS